MEKMLNLLKSPELAYVLLIFCLFVVPKFLQRFRVPSAITNFGLGMIAGMVLNLFHHDQTISLLATLGIVALFLHAGFDVNIADLRRDSRILIQHLIFMIALLFVAVMLLYHLLALEIRPAILLALALVTPSTGFILDSLHTFGLAAEEQNWVKTKAISAELLALVGMFFTLQSASITTFLISVAVVLILTLLIPMFFKFFAKKIAPYARNSEFAFVIMLAIVCATVTRIIGVYYLVGAFVVGMVTTRYKSMFPNQESDRLLHSIELFASFFVPFYFFKSGATLSAGDFGPSAWMIATVFIFLAIPARVIVVVAHRRFALAEPIRKALRVAVPMLPTLIFTLVLAQILRDEFAISDAIYGALVIYAVVSSILTSLVFRSPEPNIEDDMLQR